MGEIPWLVQDPCVPFSQEKMAMERWPFRAIPPLYLKLAALEPGVRFAPYPRPPPLRGKGGGEGKQMGGGMVTSEYIAQGGKSERVADR